MRLLFISVFTLIASSILAQTCCSSGVPISNSLGLPQSTPKSFQAAFSYDYNYLNNLKTEAESFGAINRLRKTESILGQFGYVFNEAWSIEALGSYVTQSRRTTLNNGLEEATKTNGIGDIVFMAKHDFFAKKDKEELSLGLGAKLPTGISNATNNQGQEIIADLQPGTGSLDGLFWSRYSSSIGNKSKTISISPSYKFNGENDSYLNNRAVYEFGNELQILVAINDQFVMGQKLVNASIGSRYRNRARDVQAIQGASSLELPGTGGEWIILEPSVAIQVNQNLGITINSDLPLYAKVNETQLTPSFRLNGGIYINLLTKNSTDDNLKK